MCSGPNSGRADIESGAVVAKRNHGDAVHRESVQLWPGDKTSAWWPGLVGLRSAIEASTVEVHSSRPAAPTR